MSSCAEKRALEYTKCPQIGHKRPAGGQHGLIVSGVPESFGNGGKQIVSSIILHHFFLFCNINYDELRACEVEKQILLWHDKLNKEQMDIYNEVNDIFKKYFKFQNVYYDKSRFCFYKFVMVPYKLGFVLKNKYCSFDINIIDLNSPIKNEV